MRNFICLIILAFTITSLSCSGGAKNAAVTSKNASPEVKKGVTPIADSEAVLIELETAAYGTIKIELYSNLAPKMVERFKMLAREGYYEGIAFHRINPSVIQAGNADTKPGKTPNPMKEADSGKPNVDAEFSDVPYDTGILGAARLGTDVNSQNSQFFITLKREAGFDNNYTIFGKVVEGMNNVRTIAGVPRDGERPQEPVRIKKVSVVPR